MANRRSGLVTTTTRHWSLIDNEPSRRFPIYCRGNMGEVYPNVMTPLSGSLVYRAAQRGQEAVVLDVGFVSRSHIDDSDGAITGVFGGYLYGNVSLTRVGAARTPGMTVRDLDEQMFGLSDAPPHVARPDDKSVRCTARLGWHIGRAILRPDVGLVERDRAAAKAWIAGLRTIDIASDHQLLDIARKLPAKFEEMMAHLLRTSMFAGVTRSGLERLAEKVGDPSIVNRLTAGLGNIESAEPAFALWKLARTVNDDPNLTEVFDAGVHGLLERTETIGATAFLAAFDRFLAAHGTRGPDEWELGSLTWGLAPAIALEAIDRLRHSPDDRDPRLARARLAADREAATIEALRSVPRSRRAMLRRLITTAAIYAGAREATKATFVRTLDPARRALHELARRHEIDRTDFFLLTIDELPDFLDEPANFDATIAERRANRNYLQERVPPFWFEGAIAPPDTWPLRADRLQPDPSGRVIAGLGVCPGRATGTARVIVDPAKPGRLTPGDILVAPITDPAWTPLFLAVAGVVVDVGAHQSHAAIIARELGIPTVVSATGASTTIPDGALITVDGTMGSVTVHEDPSEVSRREPKCA